MRMWMRMRMRLDPIHSDATLHLRQPGAGATSTKPCSAPFLSSLLPARVAWWHSAHGVHLAHTQHRATLGQAEPLLFCFSFLLR